ncbi:MAG: GNAT family N-acetyltransferase [Candidatus Thiodiazotropha sp. L084R]
MKDHQLTTIWEPSRDEIEPILDGLSQFGIQAIGGVTPKSVAVLLKDTSGSVVGGASGQEILRHFHLNNLWVDSSLRGQGYGTHILQRIIGLAREMDCSEIRLDSMNPRTKSFYEKQGFKIYAEIADYLPGFTRTFYTKLV